MQPDDRPFDLSYPLSFLAKAAVVAGLASALGLVILRWVFSRDLGDSFAPAFYMLRNLIHFLVPALLFSLLAVLLVAACALFAVAVFASHKVAGPLFRLQRVAGYLGRGVLVGRIHLRAGDEGRPVASRINAWVEGRKARLRALRLAAEELDGALCACEAAGVAADAATRERLVHELLRVAEALNVK